MCRKWCGTAGVGAYLSADDQGCLSGSGIKLQRLHCVVVYPRLSSIRAQVQIPGAAQQRPVALHNKEQASQLHTLQTQVELIEWPRPRAVWTYIASRSPETACLAIYQRSLHCFAIKTCINVAYLPLIKSWIQTASPNQVDSHRKKH
jgi:hypothetical protein